MEPKAILVVYEPGCKFKNHKYLLSAGPNIVGRGEECIVDLPERFTENTQQQQLREQMNFSIGRSRKFYAANIFMTENFVYVESLLENMVKIKLNTVIEGGFVRKKDNFFVSIDSGCRYVLPIQEFFYIGEYKCIVQIQPSGDLKKVNKLLNLEHFETPGKEQYPTQKYGQAQQNLDRMEIDSDKTQKVESQQGLFDPTLVLDNDEEMFMPTIDLNDERQNNSEKTESLLKPRLNSQNHSQGSRHLEIQSPFQSQEKNSNRSPNRSPNKSPVLSTPRSPVNRAQKFSQFSEISMFTKHKNFSQEDLYKAIKRESELKSRQKSQESDDDVSMPATINQNEQIENNFDKGSEQSEMEMPPTINEDEPIEKVQNPTLEKQNSREKRGQIKMKVVQKPSYDSNLMDDDWLMQGKYAQSDKPSDNLAKQEMKGSDGVNEKKFSSSLLMDLDRNPNIIKVTPSLTSSENMNFSEKRQSGLNHSKEEDELQKSSPRKSLFREVEKPKNLTKVNVAGFRLTAVEKIQLRKRGYELIKSSDDPFELYIVEDNSKETAKIIHAILIGKKFVTRNWLSSENWKEDLEKQPQGTVEGIDWSIIQAVKDTKQIFKGSFFVTSTVKQYQKIIEIAGGKFVSLDKRKKISIVLDVESQKDKQFYMENKSAKNWSFYSKKLVSESILLGEAQWEKYRVDHLSF